MRLANRSLTAGLCAALLAASSLTAKESTWLPPEVAEGAAQQLAERMRWLPELVDEEHLGGERLLAGTRQTIGAIIEVVDSWGSAGVLDRAPELAVLALPPTGDVYLDAMASYQICNVLLYLQLEDPERNADLDTRTTSVFGLSAVTLTLLSLRQPFLAAGGDPAAVEAYLAGPVIESALQSLQSDAAVRGAAEADCEPVVTTLLEEPLSRLGQ